MRIIATSMCVVTLAAVGCSDAPRDVGQQQAPLVRPVPVHPIFDCCEEELESAKAKITWLGTQDVPIQWIVFHTDKSDGSLREFFTVQGKAYASDFDQFPVRRFSVTPPEFRKILSAVKSTVGTAEPLDKECYSFSVVRHNRAQRKDESCEVFVSGKEIERKFFQCIFDNLAPNNTRGRNIIKLYY